jgi:hypothetical protein
MSWNVAIAFMVLTFVGGSDDVARQPCSLHKSHGPSHVSFGTQPKNRDIQ